MRKTTQKQQRRSSTDSLIKTGKKRDIELAEDELDQVTGGETKSPSAKFGFMTRDLQRAASA
jgi:hypothetical protein